MQGLLDPATDKRSWSLRVCQNNECPRRVWDRNTSAAINILYLFLRYATGKGRPQAFRRGGNILHEADVPDEEALIVE